MKIYFFDFDGTLIFKDSMYEFLFFFEKFKILYYVKNLIFFPFYILFLFNIITKTKAKEIFLNIHLFNKKENEINICSKKFSKHILKFLYKDAAIYLSNIKDEKKCIVTASLDIWMKDIAEELGCSLISTQSVFKNNYFSHFRGLNCYGIEKVNRIKSKYNLSKYDEIYVFGDSDGDTEMMSLSTKSHFRFFKKL